MNSSKIQQRKQLFSVFHLGRLHTDSSRKRGKKRFTFTPPLPQPATFWWLCSLTLKRWCINHSHTPWLCSLTLKHWCIHHLHTPWCACMLNLVLWIQGSQVWLLHPRILYLIHYLVGWISKALGSCIPVLFQRETVAAWQGIQLLVIHSSLHAPPPPPNTHTASLSVALRRFLGKAHTNPISFPACSCLSSHWFSLSSKIPPPTFSYYFSGKIF